MKLAVLADIHGNRVALEAVLDDASAQGVHGWWLLGDLCAIGPEPSAVLRRVRALPNATFVRGNTERYVLTGEGPPPSATTVRARPDLLPLFAKIAASFAWTRGYLTADGWLEWLEELPLQVRETTRSGVRVLGVHASPGTDDGEGVHPGRSDAELGALLEGAEADLVLVGHTHQPMARRVGDVLVANVGSVGNPLGTDARASYVLLESTGAGVDIVHRRVEYDTAAFEESVRRSRHPAAEYILAHTRGERRGREPHPDQARFVEGAPIRVRPRARG